MYLETTIPSYYHETRRDPVSVAWRKTTREWWDHYRSRYSLFTSRFVIAELALAPEAKRLQVLNMVAQAPVLEDPEGLEELIQYYIQHRLMPRDARGDAAHLAMASLHELDFVLTWNCQHLANVN